jgi:PAS domain-containing protein
LTIGNLHPKTSLDYVAAEMEAMVRQEKHSAELPCLRKDGSEFTAYVSGDLMMINEHNCSFGFFTDITERKRLEETLKKSNEELEKMNHLMVGRELAMADLKKEIAELKMSKNS